MVIEIDIALICQRYANKSMFGHSKKGIIEYFSIKVLTLYLLIIYMYVLK